MGCPYLALITARLLLGAGAWVGARRLWLSLAGARCSQVTPPNGRFAAAAAPVTRVNARIYSKYN